MSKRIVITGGTGFIGSALSEFLTDAGHEIVILSRKPTPPSATGHDTITAVPWDGRSLGDWAKELDGAFGVINLAGENIAAGRWTAAKKRRILASRTSAGRALTQAITQAANKPQVFIQASAIGFYGDRGDQPLDESASPGRGFLADVTQQWEASIRDIPSPPVRTVIMRIGAVLGNTGGLLKGMLPAFRMCLGGPWGNGRQWLSWVHLTDLTSAVEFFLEHPNAHGVFNLTSPTPVSVNEFSRTLAKALARPAVFRMPAFMAKLIAGDLARELLLTSQRVLPHKLSNAGYNFQFPHLPAALQNLTVKM